MSADDGDLAQKLIFPYDRKEPNLSDEQLMELDILLMVLRSKDLHP